jgi:hypothetical protein
MEARNNVLRRELDRAGFCYDAIGLIEGHCAKWLRDAADDIAAMERITLFVMVRIFFQSRSYWKAIRPQKPTVAWKLRCVQH